MRNLVVNSLMKYGKGIVILQASVAKCEDAAVYLEKHFPGICIELITDSSPLPEIPDYRRQIPTMVKDGIASGHGVPLNTTHWTKWPSVGDPCSPPGVNFESHQPNPRLPTEKV